MGVLLAKALAIAVIVYAPCPGPMPNRSCAVRPNTIYLTAGDGSRWLNHELGHLIDYNFLADSDRGMFLGFMRIKRPWIDPPNSPHEQFAEAVRLCARSTRWPPNGGGGFRYRPTVFQHRKVCRWLVGLR